MGLSGLSPHPNLYLHVHVVLEKPHFPQTCQKAENHIPMQNQWVLHLYTYRGASECSLALLPPLLPAHLPVFSH